ncbi:MAG: type I phosphomannose isomerase catalytic subunit [Clostridium sp.]|uniref:type I phosphomannose isomerase catalytic subunit n=1 Tax=Clostridium sp. TaxID=1506 RepID=UPI00304FC755
MKKIFMYPLKLNNLYYDKIWGGRGFEKFRSNLTSVNIGESWDVSCYENGKSVIENGWLKGLTLEEAIKIYPVEIMGKNQKDEEFQLLLKIISTEDKLSIQVHPGDDYALKHEGSRGKTEVWYILDAGVGANIIFGTKNCTKEEFKAALEENNLDKYLNKVQVKKGQVYFIPRGLIHGIGANCTILEVQQSSDLTYRVYDYDRGREIHVKKALDVIDFSLQGKAYEAKIKNESQCGGANIQFDYFKMEKFKVDKVLTQKTESFLNILTCVEGNGKILYENGVIDIEYCESIVIPESLGSYEVHGNLEFIKTSPKIGN